jgi:hypothetical protein
MAAPPSPPERTHDGGGILPSNVSAATESEPARNNGARLPFAVLLAVLIAFVLGAGVVLLFWSSPGRSAPQSTGSAPTPAPNRLTTASSPGAPLPTVNGITCDALESTLFHIHVHLAIFFDGQEQLIPFGVGVGQPWVVTDSSRGPFVRDGSCFYWLHTHTADGVVHIESPVRRRFTLGDFFAIWQEPLSATQVGPATGPVIVYVNGARDATDPAEITLTSHARIQLDVGQDVPPYPFDFAPGD